MLDLIKPVRTKNGHMPCTVVGKKLDGTLILEEADGFVFFRVAEALENIPEPKVAEALVAVYRDCADEIFLYIGHPEYNGPTVRITYTEGAENPWAIEGIKP